MNGFNDFRYGLRILFKQPTFTIVAVLTLALGIGANTAIFSVVNGVLLRPLPYEEPDRLVVVWGTDGDRQSAPSSSADFLDWCEQNKVFDGLTAYFPAALTMTGGDEPERLRGLQVTPNFFEVLGVEPVLGRAFSLEEDATGEPTVILSHEFWQRRFGGSSSVVQETLTLDGKVYSIIGVMPQGFQFATEEADVWLRPPRDMPVPPIDLPGELDLLTVRGLHWLMVVGRLSHGVAVEEAQAEMDVITGRLAEEYEDDVGRGARVVAFHEQVVGDVRPALLVLLGAVGFVLLIACGNVANLLLARATGREKEIAIRTSLGASRVRLIGQLLTESVALSILGGALGLFFALWTVDLILAFGPDVLPSISVIELDGSVLLFTFTASVLTGLIFGLLPALQASKPDIQSTLKEGGRLAGGRERRRLRASLVVAELGLALVLLIGAVLMARSFVQLQKVDPGFVSEKVLTLRLWLSRERYPEDSQVAGLYTDVLDRVGSLPRVQSASAVLGVPLSGTNANFSFSIEGRPAPPPGEEYAAGFQSVSSGYFQTMGISLLGGRDFNERDDADASPVAVVNETLARRYWSGEDPIGKRMSLDDEEWIEIIGVIGDVRHSGLDSEPRPEIYMPYPQAPIRFMTLVVKTKSEPLDLVGAVRSQVLAVDRNLPIYKVMSMEQVVSESMAQPRFNMILLGAFSLLALALATIGIYGVMSYAVSQRTHEIGIRIAMGARARDVLRMVVKQGMRLTVIGIGLGLAAAWVLTRILSSFLFSVTATDPLTYIGVSLVLAVVAFVATYLPARRATRVEP